MCCIYIQGYYITRIGEQIQDRYQVRGALGKGVFSTVLSCIDHGDGDKVVAIKLIRNNDVMRKAAMKETSILTEIGANDEEDKKHCIKMLSTFFHRNHTVGFCRKNRKREEHLF
jgi:serine/threonine-protein kinase PRP4